MKFVVFLALTLCCLAARGAPNVVVIVSDDAGYNDFGFMSKLNDKPTDVKTPNLDTLAANSVVMSSGYVAAPVCSPSRASFLTGQYGSRFGYEDNPGDGGGSADTDALQAGQRLISHELKDLGYTTGLVGKWHLGELDGTNRPLDMGFDEFYGTFGGGRPYFYYSQADDGRAMRRGDESIEPQWAKEGNPALYDPTRGRYVTDAYGEEAVNFINGHAHDDNPFFLYVAFQSPHTPLEATKQDLALFADIADPSRRALAANTYAMDRAVGSITEALRQNGLDENTIVTFFNDNGGPAASVGPYDNGLLRGNKGSVWEGGIRVPFIFKAPGLAPGVYDEPVSSVDLLSTYVSAAGGTTSELDTDGVDLMPFLKGDSTGDPHEVMFWRHADGRFAVRKGDWKLVRPGSSTFARLVNMVDDERELNYENTQHPEIVTDMLHELTFWEVTLEKPKWGALGAPRNRFDHFVFNGAAGKQWSKTGNWYQAGTANAVVFRAEDAYANAILEFNTRDDADYTSTNDMVRATLQTFMLNEIRMTGAFAGAAAHKAIIDGNPLLFTKNLEGRLPTIRLDATSNSAHEFGFQMSNNLQLVDDLQITGDGTQSFVMSGSISDYFQPKNVVKSGSSVVRLRGKNTFKGALFVYGGSVILDSLDAAIDGANSIDIGSDAKLVVENGKLAVQNIALHGGTFAPDGVTTIPGAFVQASGSLELELGNANDPSRTERLVVGGTASLAGVLDVRLVDGFMPALGRSFNLLGAGSVSGQFSDVKLPALANGMWHLTYRATSVELLHTVQGDYNGDRIVNALDYTVWRNSLVSNDLNADGDGDRLVTAADFDIWKANNGAIAPSAALAGDYNDDGFVDALDYTVWRNNLGDPDETDLHHNGDGGKVGPSDFDLWKKNYGRSLNEFGGGGLAQSAVPEPTALAMMLAMALPIVFRRGWRGLI